MFQVAMVRNGKVCQTFQVGNLAIFEDRLMYLSKYTVNGIIHYVMAVKDDCDITSLSTGNVGQIAKGLA